MSNKKELEISARLRARSKPENRRFVQKNVDVAQQVRAILKEKGMTQDDLARLLGKHPSEVSKLISGLHNLTLESITKMEEVLEADIILTPQRAKEQFERVTYFTVYANINTPFTQEGKPLEWSEKETAESFTFGMVG